MKGKGFYVEVASLIDRDRRAYLAESEVSPGIPNSMVGGREATAKLQALLATARGLADIFNERDPKFCRATFAVACGYPGDWGTRKSADERGKGGNVR